MRTQFGRFARMASDTAGSPPAFAAACALIIVWAASGPAFGFTDTWQLVINTSTTILTFLMVFIIQNSQNRDSRALHAKLDELIKQQRAADNALLGAEDLSDVELKTLKGDYEKLAAAASEAKTTRPKTTRARTTKAAEAKTSPSRTNSTSREGTTNRRRGSDSPSRAAS